MARADHIDFQSILITGGDGQLGKALQECSGQLISGIFHFFTRDGLDITRPEAIQKVFRTCRPGLVINAAAYTAVDTAETESEKAFRANRDGSARP